MPKENTETKDKTVQVIRDIIIMICGSLFACGLVWAVTHGASAASLFSMKTQGEQAKGIESNLQEIQKWISRKVSLDTAEKLLEKLPEEFLDNEQKRRCAVMRGDIALIRYNDSDDHEKKAGYFKLAANQYEKASEFCKGEDMRKERNELLRRTASLYVEKKQYREALRILSHSSEMETMPVDRWQMALLVGKCLFNTGRPYEAVAKLKSVADETDDLNVWSEALLAKAAMEKECAQTENSLRLYAGKDKISAKGALQKHRRDLLSESRKDYQKVLAKNEPGNRYAAEARLGTLDIAILRMNRTEAYELVNSIQNAGGGIMEKARAMLMLAGLHEREKEYTTAIKILESCMASYPINEIFIELATRLYHCNLEAKRQARAFHIFQNIMARSGVPMEVVEELIRDISGKDKTFLESIINDRNAENFILHTRADWDRFAKNRPDLWKRIQYDAEYFYIQLLREAGKYDLAEKTTSRLLSKKGLPRNVEEKLLMADLQTAIDAKRHSVVILARAQRLLNEFPAGKIYRRALMNIMDQYYDMGFYEESLNAARKLYVDMMRTNVPATDADWRKTVVKIGSSYNRLGKHTMSNTILREISDIASAAAQHPGIAKIWVDSALERGQILEAMRRFDVVLPHVENIDDKAELTVARYLLQLKNGSYFDFGRTSKLLEHLEKSTKLEDAHCRDLRRELWKGLLEYALTHEVENIDGFAERAAKDYPEEPWVRTWILLSFSRAYRYGGLPALSVQQEKMMKMEKLLNNSNTFGFIRSQQELIGSLLKVSADTDKFKKERGL